MKRNAMKHIPFQWVILALVAPAVFASVTIYNYTQNQQSNTETALETSAIGTGDIILTATGIGELANEEVSFGFKYNGQVKEVLVSLGEQVEAGQVLARLESRRSELKYKQAKANYEALTAESNIAAARQAVEEAKLSFDTARDDLQHIIGPELLVGEEAVASAQTALDTATAAAQKAPSDSNKQKVTEAQAALAQAQQTRDYAYYNYYDNYVRRTFTFPIRNDGGVTIRRDLIAPTQAEIDGAHAAYDLAKDKLNNVQDYLDVLLGKKSVQDAPTSSVTAITEAKLALDSAADEFAGRELVAPISGTVTSLNVSDGENVGTSAVVTITKINQPYVIDVSLDETDWDTAKVGYAATVTFDLLPDKDYTGKVIQVYPALDDSSGISMIHVLVQLDQAIDLDIPAGSTASVDVTGGEALGAVLVPTTALKETESGAYIVYLIKNDKPVEQSVEIGLQDIMYAEVKSGLKAGDVVLMDATAINQ